MKNLILNIHIILEVFTSFLLQDEYYEGLFLVPFLVSFKKFPRPMFRAGLNLAQKLFRNI